MDNLLIKKVCDILYEVECENCNFFKACGYLDSNGKDIICDMVIDNLDKEENK